MNIFCYLDSGSVYLIIDEQVKKQLGRGEGFGELGLIYGTRRSGTITSAEACALWVLECAAFEKVHKEIKARSYEDILSFLHSIKLSSNGVVATIYSLIIIRTLYQ